MLGNAIGLNVTANTALGNSADGVHIAAGAANNVIGGAVALTALGGVPRSSSFTEYMVVLLLVPEGSARPRRQPGSVKCCALPRARRSCRC